MLRKLTENTRLQILIVALAAFLTFAPTLENFFYLDEWGNLYEWTHGYSYNYSLFTVGVFRFLFDTFGMNPTGYYAAGLAVYVVSAILFYLVAAKMLKNKLLGLAAGLLYATSPIGIITSTMVWTYVCEGGYPLTVMLLLLMYLLLAFLQGRNKVHLILLFLAFLLFLEFMPRRSFMFLPILIFFDYVVSAKKYLPSLGFLARSVVLFVLFIVYYKYDVALTKIFMTGRINLVEAASGYDWEAKVEIAKAAIVDPRPLITLANTLLAGPWIFASEKLKGYVGLADINDVRVVVFVTLGLALLLIILTWRVKREWGLYSLFALGWIYINILGIFIFSSPGVSEATHRTISLAAPGYGLFVTMVGAGLYAFLLKKKTVNPKLLKKLFVGAFVALVLSNFLATKHVFEQYNEFHSRPAHAFFKDMKSYYPTLPVESLLYFEIPSNPQIKYKLSRIYGGNNYGAASSIAAFYPERTMTEIKVVYDWALVLEFIKGDKTKIDRVFTFYFDDNGLKDTTAEIREQLRIVN